MDNFWKMWDVRTRQVSNYQRNSEGMFTWSPTFLGDISPGSWWFWFNLVFASPANSFVCFLNPIMFLLVDGCIDDIIMMQYILIIFAHSYHSWVHWRSYYSVPIWSMYGTVSKNYKKTCPVQHHGAYGSIWEYLYYMI